MAARIVVLAGVNGAGKSSVAGAAILDHGGAFYNPDATAREFRDSNPALTVEQANAAAWELGRRGLEQALANGEFFALETTLGARTIPAMLRAGARQGAEVHVLYVGLASPEQHLRRVANRVAAGGHDIPEEKIRERFDTSRQHLIGLLPFLASLRVYDNSREANPNDGKTPTPMLLLHMTGGQVVSHAPLSRIPSWAKPILAAALGLAGP